MTDVFKEVLVQHVIELWIEYSLKIVAVPFDPFGPKGTYRRKPVLGLLDKVSACHNQLSQGS